MSRPLFNLSALALLTCACATSGKLGKFQVLAERVRISGVVVAVSGTDFDLLVENGVADPWPAFKGIVHCEVYGHDGLPEEQPGAALTVGQRIAVSGALVLDNAVHADEEAAHPERAPHRGLLRGWRPKPELHPYLASSIVLYPPPPEAMETRRIRVGFFAETYSTSWEWNKVMDVDGQGVPGSWTEATIASE